MVRRDQRLDPGRGVLSTVNEVRNAYGAWTLDWRPDTPVEIRAACDTEKFPFSLVRIYAAPVDSGLVGTAVGLFSGLLMSSDPGSIGGYGPTWLAGTPGGSVWDKRDGAGPFTTDAIGYDGSTGGTLTQWLTDILGNTLSGLSVGYVGGPSTMKPGIITAHTVRTVLDSYLTSRFGVEWRINDRLQVDVGYQAQLYPTTTVPIAARGGGREPDATVLQVTDLGLSTDWSDWITRAMVRREGGGTYQSASTSVRKNPGTGADLNYRSIVDTDGQTVDEATDQANKRFAESGRTRSADISAREYDLPSRLPVGSFIDVWDPDEGFYDFTRATNYKGDVIHPVRLRVQGIEWPVHDGMGVWLDRRNITGDTDDLIDLTPHIEWAAPNADTKVTVGRPPHTIGR